MEKVEKVLLLAVLGVAVMIIAVMSFIPESDTSGESSAGQERGVVADSVVGGSVVGGSVVGGKGEKQATKTESRPIGAGTQLASSHPGPKSEPEESKIAKILGQDYEAKPLPKSATGPAASENKGENKGDEPGVFPGNAVAEDANGTKAGNGGDETGGALPADKSEGGTPDDPSESGGGAHGATFAFRDLTKDPHNPAYAIYRVRAGDTLSEIAARFCNNDQRAIEAVNEGLDPNSITEGQQLWIPWDIIEIKETAPVNRAVSSSQPPAQPNALPAHAGTPSRVAAKPTDAAKPQYRIVKDGDTLWGIASEIVGPKKATKHVLKLRQWNPRLRNSDRIKEGDRLRVK